MAVNWVRTRVVWRRRAGMASLFALLGAALLPAGDAYGPNPQVLHVGAAEFRSIDPINMPGILEVDLDGYLRNYTTSAVGFNVYAAPLRLPAGAQITSLCLYYFNSLPNPAGVSVELDAHKLAPAGQPSGVVPLALIYSSYNGGFGVTCGDVTPPFTVRDTADIDDDGSAEHVAYYLNVRVRTGDTGQASLGGVRVFWQRQVSPPPGSPTFNDVPANDGGFAFIEALVASGVTAGCGGGNFCPDAPLTRRQMAVFLAKALGLHWPD